jgi:hypothetical protein
VRCSPWAFTAHPRGNFLLLAQKKVTKEESLNTTSDFALELDDGARFSLQFLPADRPCFSLEEQ